MKTSCTSLSGTERNDCSVLALSAASGLSYSASHSLHRKNGRVDRKGTTSQTVFSTYKQAGFEARTIYSGTRAAVSLVRAQKGINKYLSPDSVDNAVISTSCTVSKFQKENPKGSFILLVAGHALAVVDGVIKDNASSSKLRKVYCCFCAK